MKTLTKAIHIAKSLEKITSRPKLVNKYVFATAEIKSQLLTISVLMVGTAKSERVVDETVSKR